MTQIKLKRLLSKRKESAAILQALVEANNLPVTIQDVDGNLLLGDVNNTLPKYPILCGDDTIGWVIGPKHTAPVAHLIGHLAEKEAEKNAMADEMLDHYRELNLLYNLSEKLAASLELASVAQIALGEAGRLITASGGSVMIQPDGSEHLESIAAFGWGIQPQPTFKPGEGIIGQIALNGKAEIINDIRADPRHLEGQALTAVSSLACVSLKTKDRVIGAIVLVSQTAVTYTAKDLKLLSALASQAAPAIENAILYEKTVREAKQREERLQRQIRELRIELDDARQAKQLAEITETDYFQQLRSQADDLRKIIKK
jgi:transcriptional regulator with GAF, ATPase, and Fis domain